ncbi:glycosyltransferase family 4 protein [Acidisoma sp. S159]|uniref:glycosyltransferase family 4 protein n=1 Tax=Acidisoma sp. S159 TaxID=1747225 RepID=UPI00131B7739|nr:glycosyltransferase family 4 protein [Acidisoma sp. S159]
MDESAADALLLKRLEDLLVHQGEGDARETAIPTQNQKVTPTDLSVRAEQGSRVIDLFDDDAVARAVGWPVTRISLAQTRPEPVVDRESAIHFVITLLRRRPDLRRCFPQALSGGMNGGFARWLTGEGADSFFKPGSPAKSLIRTAFQTSPERRGLQVAVYDEKLRQSCPLFLLPSGRRWLIATLFGAVDEHLVTLDEVWWTLLSVSEQPFDQLSLIWLVTPEWQKRFPSGGSSLHRRAFASWLHYNYSVDPSETRGWSTAAMEARPEKAVDGASTALSARTLPGRGVNVLGHFCYPSGLRTSLQNLVASLNTCGVETALRNVPAAISTDEPDFDSFLDTERFDISIIHVQPAPFFVQAYARAGLRERTPRTYRIGYWYWESLDIPPDWSSAFAQCDEIWTASQFVADALSASWASPVKVLPPGYELPEFTRRSRADFKLPENTFIFCFAFHMTSAMERKNPLAVIKAFRQAFAPDDDVVLVIKTTFGDRHPADLTLLREHAAGYPIRIIDSTMSQSEILSIIAASDAYVSLHRSEGFGLSMLEAMLLGKPVIATRYSGNLEFMDASNSLLVDFEMTRLKEDLPNYPRGLQWADPATGHAARLMQFVFKNRAEARELGLKGRRDVLAKMTYEIAGRRMEKRLAEIALMKSANVQASF